MNVNPPEDNVNPPGDNVNPPGDNVNETVTAWRSCLQMSVNLKQNTLECSAIFFVFGNFDFEHVDLNRDIRFHIY